MGNLLRLLSREPSHEDQEIFVDFENAQVTESEKKVFEQVRESMSQFNKLLSYLREYKGAEAERRQVISNPGDGDAERQLWATLDPCIEKLKSFYDFSHSLEESVPKLLEALCSGTMTPYDHLKNQQALVKQFSELLDFILTFDELKMSNPAISNDLSHYRRSMSSVKLRNVNGSTGNKFGISEGIAGQMSIFYAHPTPMLNVLSSITCKYVSNNQDIKLQNVTETFSTMIRVCQKMIERRELYERLERPETILFILRVMVGLIILYDHVHPEGAFVKSSHIDIKSSVKIIRDQQPSNETLLNALRFTTKHLKDDATPRQIKVILG